MNWHGSGFGEDLEKKWIGRSAEDPILILSLPLSLPLVLPMFTSDSEFCYYLAKSLNIVVIDADYRKAPENPFPLQSELYALLLSIGSLTVTPHRINRFRKKYETTK